MNISSIQLLYSKLNARVIILQDLSPSHHPVKLVLLKNRAKTNSNFKSRVLVYVTDQDLRETNG